MKKFILAAMTASILATPAMAAPQPQHERDNGRYSQSYRQGDQRRDNNRYGQSYRQNDRRSDGRTVQYRNFRKGERFDNRYARNYRPINNWQQYRGRHLYAPPRGYQWAQSGNDAVLVAVAGGLIGAVLAGAFN